MPNIQDCFFFICKTVEHQLIKSRVAVYAPLCHNLKSSPSFITVTQSPSMQVMFYMMLWTVTAYYANTVVGPKTSSPLKFDYNSIQNQISVELKEQLLV